MRDRVDIRTTRGLALALPIEQGQRVLIVGAGLEPLATSLANTGAAPVIEVDGPQDDVASSRTCPPPSPRDLVDHAIIVGSAGEEANALVALTRRVRPRGSLLVARTVPSRRRGPDAVVAATAEALRVGEAEMIAVYGIRQSITDVRHLVPLAGAGLRWYVRNAFLPWNRWAAVASRAAAAGAPAAMLRLMFPAVAILARRRGSEIGGQTC